MNERQSIIGFTEAELGFALAMLCLALWASGLKKPKPTLARVRTQRQAVVSADSARKLERKLAALQRTVDSLHSPILPNCQSRGIISGPLLSLTALGSGRYRVASDTLTLGALRSITARARERALAAKCVHQVVLSFLQGLSAPEYERSRQAIYRLGLRIASGESVER